MEPEGPRVAPGNSCAPPGDHTGSSRTAEVSTSFSVGEERMCNSSSPCPGAAGKEMGGADPGRDHPGRDHLGRDHLGRDHLGRDQGRGGSLRRSFPSSLTWDSDSEKETVDEEELQHFANPHGLANHSPGYPSSGLRPDGEHDQTPAHTQHLPGESDREGPVDTSDSNQRGIRTQEPNMSPPGQPTRTQRMGGSVWKVPDPPEPTRVKPKDRCQTQSEEGGERPGEERGVHSQVKHKPLGGQAKEASPDVYSFPGDSDAEGPPPSAWAQCSFTQRRRRRKALLKPYSGLAGPPPGPGRRIATPQGANAGGEEGRSTGEKEGVEEEEMVKGEEQEDAEGGGGGGGDHHHEEEDGGPSPDIFTCVECSIYFQKQVHLQEHMSEHVQSPLPGGRGERPARVAPLHCAECGWTLPCPPDLLEHRRRHQESRARILEEIQKLGATRAERLEEVQRVEEEGGVPVGLDLSSESHKAPGPVKGLDPDVNPPMLSLVPGAVDFDPALVGCADPSTSGPKAGPVRTPARARAAPTKGRRFICPTCNFSTKTSQAMANHAKTHNRTKPPARRKSQRAPYPPAATDPPAARSGATSSSMQHLHLLPEETQTSRPSVDRSRFDPQTKELVFKCIGNRRTNRRERVWTDGTQSGSRAEGRRRPGGTEEEEEGEEGGEGGRELRAVAEQKSSGRLKSHSRPSFTQDASGLTQSSAASPPLEKTVKEEEEEEEEGAEQNGRLSFLRRRNRLLAPAEEDSEEEEEEDDIDEEQMQRFLSEAILEENEEEEVDEETGRPRSVERRCPYCPDRFHNGIGLANHVRGHLNRVGVSYNVRHFISAEEVNAIEKKFSYQKKRKKVANFDPDTFSVMRCEFCGAGFDTRAGLSSHARAHLRDFGILNWDVTVSPISILREMFSSRPDLVIPTAPPRSPPSPGPLDPCGDDEEEEDEEEDEEEEQGRGKRVKSEEESGEGGGGVAGAKVARNKFRVPPPAWSRGEEDGEPGGRSHWG